MQKPELIEKVQEIAELDSKAAAGRVVEAVLDGIVAGLQKDGEVRLIGFGTFKIKDRPARTGRNIRTGATIKIKASKTVSFKTGKGLKEDATSKPVTKKAAAKKK
ncbi:DNA-binding protein HU-beta [Fibrobacterales bacterium]|nr:DNA-binding protein HU-beta [Fibrobacterales bacterium]